MFLEFSIKDAIDIVLVASLLYYFYKLMKESGSLNVFLGILVFLFSWLFVSKLLQMRLLGSIFDQLMSVGTLAERVGFTMANVSLLKNGKIKALKISTLDKLCRVLECQPADLLEYVESDGSEYDE